MITIEQWKSVLNNVVKGTTSSAVASGIEPSAEGFILIALTLKMLELALLREGLITQKVLEQGHEFAHMKGQQTLLAALHLTQPKKN